MVIGRVSVGRADDERAGLAIQWLPRLARVAAFGYGHVLAGAEGYAPAPFAFERRRATHTPNGTVGGGRWDLFAVTIATPDAVKWGSPEAVR
jgi:hypothetical protein